MTPFERIAQAVQHPERIAAEIRASGERVVWVLGWDVPRELVDGFGLHPIRLTPRGLDLGPIDALVGRETMSQRGRRLLATIAALPERDALLISHADSEQPQLFATLRELARTGVMPLPPVDFLDLLTIDRPATRVYNRRRLAATQAWLRMRGGRDAPGPALAAGRRRRTWLAELMALRREGRLTGTEAHQLLAAADILTTAELEGLLPSLLDELRHRAPDERPHILLSGVAIEDPELVARIEASGSFVIGEDHAWGADRIRPLPDDLATATLAPSTGPFTGISARAARMQQLIADHRPERVLHLRFAASDDAAWEAEALRAAAGHTPFLSTTSEQFEAVDAFLRGDHAPAPVALPEPASATAGSRAKPRSRKSLAVLERFGAFQREWFASVRQAAAAGDPVLAVNANAPQEILRAMGLPFVVNQWWASIVAAKQQSPRYAALLRQAGLPADAEAYSSQGVAAALDEDVVLAPWGGLPRPAGLATVLSTDATANLFATWASLTGARLFSFHRSVESRWDLPVRWWDGLADHWQDWIEPERLDLMEAELREAIAEFESLTGKRFDAELFRSVLDLVNEQEEFYRATRDLVARTVPAPISIADSMPATMVPQWHRGTAWARDAARDFHDEVAQRVAAGEAACPGERLRLMFVGRGVWSDMGFYQRWEASHGAVFVCSMYLSLAADGYIRRYDGRDPMRSLAARFVTMGDELRMPTWAGAWHVKEAQLHQCDGAMALSDADPLVLRALREAGFPVLELGIDNYVPDPAAEADLDCRVIEFLEGAVAAKRRTR